jgi:pyruvate dehydrogenase E1 component alpha subunit
MAIGVAMSLKRENDSSHVWCFIGDMTSETGVAQTAIRYAETHDLPITFVIEDNGISVLTHTRKVWNSETLRYEINKSPNILSYKYKSKYPHAGAGVRVQF